MAWQQPIHEAAARGDMAEVERLVEEEDGSRLNAQDRGGMTPLMWAAEGEQDAVVERLLALGADVGLRDCEGQTAAHFACDGDHASTLALLLDHGAPINACSCDGATLLMWAAFYGATECVTLLLARGGDALELDARDQYGTTALHRAPQGGKAEIVRLLLQAGADPTIRNNYGRTPLDVARRMGYQSCILFLEPAIAPQYARSLLKARALLDAALAVSKARNDAADKGEPPAVQQQEKALAAAPAYLKGRVAEGRALPAVLVQAVGEDQEQERLLACLKYALGLEGGGGWHEGEGPAPQEGMVKEVFVELCELLVPTWDRARV
jgi:hypothetical protein